MAEDTVNTNDNEDDTEPQNEASASTKSGRRTAQPEGQTIPSSQPGEDEFAAPVTAQGPGQASVQPTVTRASTDEDDDFRKSKEVKRIRSITGLKGSDILAYNEQTRVVVTAQGGKYQLSRKGDKVRHLQGPEVPKSADGSNLGNKYIDARALSPFTGTAAAINASVLESPSGTRAELANQAAQDAESAEMEAERRREAAENAAAAAGD